MLFAAVHESAFGPKQTSMVASQCRSTNRISRVTLVIARAYVSIGVSLMGGVHLISAWLHNRNIDRTLDRIGTYVDPNTSAALLKFLIQEEDKLGAGREQLQHIERRIREGEERISRILAVVERLIDHGLMDQEKFFMAVAVLTTMRDSQVLLDQHYRRISDGKRLLWGVERT